MWYYILAVRYGRYAPVAQPDRVTGYEPVGRGFESLPARFFIYRLNIGKEKLIDFSFLFCYIKR